MAGSSEMEMAPMPTMRRRNEQRARAERMKDGIGSIGPYLFVVTYAVGAVIAVLLTMRG